MITALQAKILLLIDITSINIKRRKISSKNYETSDFYMKKM